MESVQLTFPYPFYLKQCYWKCKIMLELKNAAKLPLSAYGVSILYYD